MSDIKPVFKRVNGAWEKQKAFERIGGIWVLISNPIGQWETPTIELNDTILSTQIVEGVTMYKVYSNGTYIGYIDSDNVWHGEVSA